MTGGGGGGIDHKSGLGSQYQRMKTEREQTRAFVSAILDEKVIVKEVVVGPEVVVTTADVIVDEKAKEKEKEKEEAIPAAVVVAPTPVAVATTEVAMVAEEVAMECKTDDDNEIVELSANLSPCPSPKVPMKGIEWVRPKPTLVSCMYKLQVQPFDVELFAKKHSLQYYALAPTSWLKMKKDHMQCQLESTGSISITSDHILTDEDIDLVVTQTAAFALPGRAISAAASAPASKRNAKTKKGN